MIVYLFVEKRLLVVCLRNEVGHIHNIVFSQRCQVGKCVQEEDLSRS